MTWLQLYYLRRWMRRSLWLLPVLAIGAGFVIAPLIRWLERLTEWNWFNLTPDGARTILGAFTSSMLTLVVFVVSSLLIVVQLASAQLTPRIIALLFADSRIKWVLGIFTFAYTYTIAVASRVEDTTPQLPVAFAIFCNLACIALFFWFIQFFGGLLRPIAVLQRVATEGRKVIENVYPHLFTETVNQPRLPPRPDTNVVVVEHVRRSGVMLSFSQRDLAVLAERMDLVIELIPQVGDFIARGDPLFRVQHGAGGIDEDALRECVAIGAERTLEQDPRFSFRVIVDIANKALSPAINDPTTAVLALDQLHRLLMYVGTRNLDEGELRDSKGQMRVSYGTPDWIDFVSLAVTEIRHFGASSMQVARRLHAMLVHLIRLLPAERKTALQQELALLQAAIHRAFPDEADRIQAQIGDVQGIGGSGTDRT